MRRVAAASPVHATLLVLVMSAVCCQSGGPTPALSCAASESLAVAPLLYGDAMYGMRGTSGGTLVELSRQSGAWVAVLEPVWSDFPDEDNRWPEAAETLSVRWTDLRRARARLDFRRERTDTSANRLSIGDSLVLTLECQAALLENWDHRRGVDTVRLERRLGRGWGSSYEP